MQVTWEADNPEFRGRKRVRRACSRCKKLKKRCKHTFEAFDAEENGSLYSPPVKRRDLRRSNGSEPRPLGSRPAVGLWVSKPSGRSPSSSRSPVEDVDDLESSLGAEAEEHRFLGDMNPEAALLEQQDSLCKDHQRNSVGVFQQKSAEGPSSEDEIAKEDLESGNLQMDVSQHLHTYLTAIGAFDMPTMTCQEKLVGIFLAKVNQILPLLDKASFMSAFRARTASQTLIQAICLVAAKDDEASPFLRYNEDSTPISARAFCTKLYTGLAASINADIERDHVTLARIFALMSLHCEGYQGADASSMYLAQAIHHSQSVSLQIAPANDDRQSIPKKNLFWCLWSLDKLHASMDGRAILIADRDISVPKPASTGKKKSAFDVWLMISEMLASVINYYRPTAHPETTGWEEDFPSFEDVVGGEVGSDLNPDILAILELYYHAVAVVSRRSRALERPAPSTPSLVRQTLSALRIQAILTDEFPSSLPPLPIVPYAVSLAMTVAYRQLRQSKIITHFNRAKTNLEATCTLLSNLGKTWWIARCLAKLGRKALRNVEEMQDKNATAKADRDTGRKRKSKTPTLDPALRTPHHPRGEAVGNATDNLAPSVDGHHAHPPNSTHRLRSNPTPTSSAPLEVRNQSYNQSTAANFLSPISGASISQDSGSTPSHVNDPWYWQSLTPGVFDDFDNLLGGYVDLAFPTNLWSSGLFEDGTSMDWSGGGGGGGI